MTQASSSNQSNKLWSTDYALTLLAGHIMFVSYTSLFTVIPSYVLESGGQKWHIGVIIGSFGVVSLLIRPFVGRWVNAFGPKYVVVVGLALFSFAALLYIPTFSVWWLVPN